MKYFGMKTKTTIIIKAAESREDLHVARWEQIPDISRITNERGIAVLDAGQPLTCTKHDQGYEELLGLFS